MHHQILSRNLEINLREKIWRIDMYLNETICCYILFALYLQVRCLSLALAILKHEKTRRLWIACKAYPFVSGISTHLLINLDTLFCLQKNKAHCIPLTSVP